MEPEQEPLYLPQYNKSAHAGKGDRAPRSTWPIVPRPLTVLILEGWCVGFKPLTEAELERRWREAQESLSSPATTTESQDSDRTKGLLARHELEHLRQVNDALSSYQAVLNDKFDIFIHLDIPTSPALEWVYTWRKEQESQLRLEKGPENAMTDEQVEKFVDGYMPAYELYLEGVRRGVFEGTNKRGRQLRIVLDRGRRVLGREVI
jgi:Predicted kinase